MEVDGIDGEVVAGGDLDGLIQPLEPDPELHRPRAAVLEVLVVADARTRVDADPDPRRPAPAGRIGRSG